VLFRKQKGSSQRFGFYLKITGQAEHKTLLGIWVKIVSTNDPHTCLYPKKGMLLE
jgi:hypothetical protein